MNATLERPAAGLRARPVSLTEKQRVRKISKIIRYAEKRLKRRFPILEKRDAIGLGIFLLSASAMVGVSALYFFEAIPWWSALLLNAFFASLLHEIEHDLIHDLYFKGTWIETMMMYGVWLFRGNTPSPFYRKKIHSLHHQESGQLTDIEEQMIGNGMRYNFKRLLVMFDQNLAFLLNAPKLKKQIRGFDAGEMTRAAFPIHAMFTVLLQSLIAWNLFSVLNHWLDWGIVVSAEVAAAGAVLNFLGVVYILPNVLRQFSLQLVSSSMHYFGDIPRGAAGLLRQTQVLQPWFLAPFQLFCFNFGGTHGIHHLVVNQPFYMRQIITPWAHPAMKRYGVRFNDLGTFKRANRYEFAPGDST